MIVYCHTHRKSGKKYIGQTRQTMRHRWMQHLGCVRRGATLLFHLAIEKHGPEAFDHSVLEEVDSEDEANEAERRWIAHYGSNKTEFGYNLNAGGGGGAAKNCPESKKRRSAAARAREAVMTKEQKRARAMLGFAGLPREQRSEIARRREANKDPEVRARVMANALRSRKPRTKSQPTPRIILTPEQRSDATRQREARKTPEQRSESVRKGHAKRSAASRAAAAKRLADGNRKKPLPFQPRRAQPNGWSVFKLPMLRVAKNRDSDKVRSISVLCRPYMGELS